MERKIISIDISPETTEITTENAGVMWEHNATTLVFNVDKKYIGDYRYYIEYRSLIGTKVRTEYLDLDTETNTVTYNVPITMSSLKGVECYFNIIFIDGDGNTVQVIKPHKFCLQFDYSPDTDNTLAKVNDFSINALLEAIRLGTFKGEKGDVGEKGDKGDKGEKGDTGEISQDYATRTFADAVKSKRSGNPIIIDDVSPVQHVLDIKTTPDEKVFLRGKNLIPFTNKKYNQGHSAGNTYGVNGVNFTVNHDGSVTVNGTATAEIEFPLMVWSTVSTGVHTVTLSGSPEGASSDTYYLRLSKGENSDEFYEEYGNGKTVKNVNLSGSQVHIIVKSGISINKTFYPMLEFGETVSEFVSPCTAYSAKADENGVVSRLVSLSPYMCVFTNTDTEVMCTYNCDTENYIKKSQGIVEKQIESVKEDIKSLNYRLINTITLENNSKLAHFLEDANGVSLENLKLSKIFIIFTGGFVNTTPLQPLCVLFNEGRAYQMYKTFSINANNYYGFWFESEKIISLPNCEVYRSTYPSILLGNFNADTGMAQGLNANNTEVYSDLCMTPIGGIKKITFGNFNDGNLMKSGSKIYLFGV